MQRRSRDRMLVLLSRWRVDVAWGGLLAIPWARPTSASILGALPVVAIGVALRIWARGHLERAEEVTIGGPYAHMRHPLYVGSFLIAVGFALMTGLRLLPIVVAAAFVLMYVPKALREEAYLRRRFGDAYADYARRVGAIVPSWSAATSSTSRFAWRRVIRHREWHTWIGVAAALAVMCGLALRNAQTSIVSGARLRAVRDASVRRDTCAREGRRDRRSGGGAAHAARLHAPASRYVSL